MTPRFGTIFRWHVLRYAARHKLLATLNILSVALGIAVYLAIQVANHSANESFAASVDLVAGKAHLEVRGDIDETLWPEIASAPGVKATTAVVEGVATLPDLPGEYLRLLGVDVFTSAPFSTFRMGESAQRIDLDRWLGQPGAVALTTEFAARHGFAVGTRLRASIDATTRELEVVALIDTRDSPAGAQPRFAAIDLGWAQELFGTQGHLTSIQLLLDEPRRVSEIAAALRAKLPAHLRVEPPRQRSVQVQTMLSAFRLNLTALSLVSLLVGAFLIYNTISASVARRRVELGILRALGTTRWEVRALFLGEALVFGLAGIVLGSLGGIALSFVTTQAVERTISSLYVLLSIDRQFLSLWHFTTAAGLGIAAVVAGAWFPADEAARTDPVSALSTGAHVQPGEGKRWRWSWIASSCFLLALAFSALSLRTGPPLLAFVAAFFALTGFAALAPGTTARLATLLSRFSRAALSRLAADRLSRSVHRNAVTVAALSTAISMTIGLATMIYSFRHTVDRWLGQTIVADLYIAPAANEIVGLSATVPTAALDWLHTQPEVASVDTFREMRAALARGDGSETALLAVVEGHYRSNLDFGLRDSTPIMQRVTKGEAVVVTESFSRKFRLRTGDSVPLATPHGTVTFPIAGVYRDYTRDQGAILLTRELYRQHWPDVGPNSLAVYLKPHTDPAHLAGAFGAKFGAAGEFVVYSNLTLRERIMKIFDQTFAVTEVLRVIALAVALLGVALSATTLVVERHRETGVLRAIGASAAQVRRLFMAEAAMIGAIACVIGLPSGLALALVLTWVVNPAFFGWTIHFSLPWPMLLSTALWVVPMAALAAWWPARVAASANLAEAIREE